MESATQRWPRLPLRTHRRPRRAQEEISTRGSSQDARLAPALTCGSFGADDGIRTRDPHLGKVVLYQLSHVRVLFTESREPSRQLQLASFGRSGTARGAEAPFPTRRRWELIHPLGGELRHCDDDELSDPIPFRDPNGCVAIEIDDRADDLSAIASVDEAGRVRHRQAVLAREPTARKHQARASIWDRDGNTRRNQRALARSDFDVDGGTQVEPGVAGMRSPRKDGVGVQPLERKRHAGSTSSRRLPNGSRTWNRR